MEDEVSHLIKYLIQAKLQRLAVTSDGWETLYQDPQDQRLWGTNAAHIVSPYLVPKRSLCPGVSEWRLCTTSRATIRSGPFCWEIAL
jgi:hypothetical protein